MHQVTKILPKTVGTSLPTASGATPSPLGGDGAFDAFDSNSWYFEPAPAPWYRGKQALIALIAASTAAAALVVAAVLLVFQSGRRGGRDHVGHRNRADNRGVARARHQ